MLKNAGLDELYPFIIFSNVYLLLLLLGACVDQYTGKTTVPFSKRMVEHIQRQKTSSVYKHRRTCEQCKGLVNFKCSFVEDYRNRGKYTLSEREYLELPNQRGNQQPKNFD